MSRSAAREGAAGAPRPHAAPGWVFYDAECRFCSGLAAWLARPLERRGFHLEPQQSANGRSGGFDLWAAEGSDEMQVLTREGAVVGGADALLYLARWFWWARPLVLAGRAPLIRAALRRAYAWIASRRHCLAAGCQTPNRS